MRIDGKKEKGEDREGEEDEDGKKEKMRIERKGKDCYKSSSKEKDFFQNFFLFLSSFLSHFLLLS